MSTDDGVESVFEAIFLVVEIEDELSTMLSATIQVFVAVEIFTEVAVTIESDVDFWFIFMVVLEALFCGSSVGCCGSNFFSTYNLWI